MDWFLYHNGLRHERVKVVEIISIAEIIEIGDKFCIEMKSIFYIFTNLSKKWTAAVTRRCSLKKSQAAGLQLYQKETPVDVLSCEVCKIFQNTSGRLLIQHGLN